MEECATCIIKNPLLAMTKVDFYVLAENSFENCITFTCRLAAKVFQQGHGLLIKAPAKLTTLIDKALWQHPPAESFLPHAIDNTKQQLIVKKLTDPAPPSVVINMNADLVEQVDRYQRILQILPNHPELLAQGRQQFRHYQQLGLAIHTHKLTSHT